MSGADEVEIVIAVGGNVPPDRNALRAQLNQAVAALRPAGFFVLRRSRWWVSAAWPEATDPPFLNAVILARTMLAPEAALDALQRLERDAGRSAGRRNGPRPLDLDLIAYGDLQLATERLTLPHPRARERLFAMGPLAEIAPDWRWPGTGETAAELARASRVGLDAAPERPEPAGG